MSNRFSESVAVVRAGMATCLGCDALAFETEALTIVDRVEPAVWPYVAVAATFGTGTVLSVDAGFREFVETLAPEKHYQAAWPKVLQPIAAEARRRGASPITSPTEIGWTLATVPAPPEVPRGFELRVLDVSWMAAEMQRRRFEHGIGLPGEGGRDFRNRYAAALFDASGEPVAVAGVMFTYADPIREIGVDVARPYRGQGMGTLVVAAAVREILERGEVPIYMCAATNIRSQRTALAAGFLPAFSNASVA